MKAATVTQSELIGLKARVLKSTNPSNIGISGKITDETRNTITIRHENDDKIIAKEVALFQLTLQDGTVVEVEGNYDDVNRLCSEVYGDLGWGFVNVNLRPYYAEGSKTVGHEIARDLGWRAPDHVVAPMASGEEPSSEILMSPDAMAAMTSPGPSPGSATLPRRTFIVPMKSATNAVRGRTYRPRGVSTCSTRPSRKTATRSAIDRASFWSWVT